MKIVATIVAVLLCLNGCIWILQGINILPGSFMTGQIKWAMYGAISLAAGLALLFWTYRKRKS